MESDSLTLESNKAYILVFSVYTLPKRKCGALTFYAICCHLPFMAKDYSQWRWGRSLASNSQMIWKNAHFGGWTESDVLVGYDYRIQIHIYVWQNTPNDNVTFDGISSYFLRCDIVLKVRLLFNIINFVLSASSS